jgi:hypothetical protein
MSEGAMLKNNEEGQRVADSTNRDRHQPVS